jgi:hypothetical protein
MELEMTTEATGNPSVETELLAEIARLRAALKGPEGFATWEEAFHAERLARVRAEQELFSTQVSGQDGWVLLDLATQCAEKAPSHNALDETEFAYGKYRPRPAPWVLQAMRAAIRWDRKMNGEAAPAVAGA